MFGCAWKIAFFEKLFPLTVKRWLWLGNDFTFLFSLQIISRPSLICVWERERERETVNKPQTELRSTITDRAPVQRRESEIELTPSNSDHHPKPRRAVELAPARSSRKIATTSRSNHYPPIYNPPPTPVIATASRSNHRSRRPKPQARTAVTDLAATVLQAKSNLSLSWSISQSFSLWSLILLLLLWWCWWWCFGGFCVVWCWCVGGGGFSVGDGVWGPVDFRKTL